MPVLIATLIFYIILLPVTVISGFGQTSTDVITGDAIHRHLMVLGADSLEGRGTGTRGERKAAEYIVNVLKNSQITPLGEQGGYFQSIPMDGSTPQADSELRLFCAEKIINFRYGADYLLYKSGAQTFVPTPVELVFAGYGIVAPEYDYNDYQSLDVRDKIVVYLSGEPYSTDTAYFAGAEPTIYSLAESKQRIAVSRGARGSIMINNPREENTRSWQYLVKTYSFEDVTLAYTVSSHLSLIANITLAEAIFSNARYSLEQVFALDSENKLSSFLLKTSLSFKGKFLERDFFSQNICGIINGANSKFRDQYVLLSAHYDHLGIGPAVDGDSIYNGVLDNAIGVAALLEFTRLLKTESPPQRPVIILFTSGEEKGLLGSTYYIDHPPAPLYKTIANVNIDGLASFDETRNMVALGAEFSTIRRHLEQAALETGIACTSVPANIYAFESFTRSDQLAFAMAGIPAILIMEGMDYVHFTTRQGEKYYRYWMETIYHSPQDDLEQFINFYAVEQHASFIFSVINKLANSVEIPVWHSGTPYKQAWQRIRAEKR